MFNSYEMELYSAAAACLTDCVFIIMLLLSFLLLLAFLLLLGSCCG